MCRDAECLTRIALIVANSNALKAQRPVNFPEQTILVLTGKFVLPNSQDCPTALTERAIYDSVASFVAGEFISPEGTIGSRLCCVLGAAVPETTVQKKRKSRLSENEIWFAEHRLIAPPAGDALLAE